MLQPSQEKPLSLHARLKAQRKGNMYLIARKDLAAWTVVGHRPKKTEG